MSPLTSSVYPGVEVPIPIRVFEVSATKRSLVPAAFCMMNALDESTAFWKVLTPLNC